MHQHISYALDKQTNIHTPIHTLPQISLSYCIYAIMLFATEKVVYKSFTSLKLKTNVVSCQNQ